MAGNRWIDRVDTSGTTEGCLRVPYTELDDVLGDIEHPLLQHLADGKQVTFFCAFGERSALALSRIDAAYADNCYHLKDGMDAWLKKKHGREWHLWSPGSTTGIGTILNDAGMCLENPVSSIKGMKKIAQKGSLASFLSHNEPVL